MPEGKLNSNKHYIRVKLWKRQYGICPYCDISIPKPENGTIEHIKPLRLGGGSTLENILLVHSECNALKGGFASYEEVHEYAFKLLAFFRKLDNKKLLRKTVTLHPICQCSTC